MSIFFFSDITQISLDLSMASLVLVVVLSGFVWLRLQKVNTLSNDIDASALVSEFGERQKRIEQRVIDQKVRLEILELRLSREKVVSQRRAPPLFSSSISSIPNHHQEAGESVVHIPLAESVIKDLERSASTITKLTNKKDATITDILESVMKGDGAVTARQIQQQIGRSMEHTARMMNLLYKEGLVSRDASARPFTYSLTAAGKRELEG